ncbi:MAG: prolyl aminopeptidase [Hyphomicrobium sp.]|jgi:proline iminopeptidase
MCSTEAARAPIRPFDARMLDVGDGHWIYVEEVGCRDGIPALFLHGGPGSGAQHSHRELFNPQRFHAILFDQRGAGRSHPYLSTHANTTQHLIADIERVREHFGIERWLVVGGSWGSTLALAYAEAYPARVTGLVLRAIFLGTAREVEWAFSTAPQQIRPDLYSAFVHFLPPDERRDPIAAFVTRLTNPDARVHAPAALVWNAYERSLSELRPANAMLPDSFEENSRVPPTPLLEAHYIKNNFFLEPDAIMEGAAKLAGIPGVIVQGRYDLLCPPATAFKLAKRWPGCRLEIMDAAGHAVSEPGVFEAMRLAVDELSGKR